MPGGTRSQLGNELFGQMTYQASVTFPTLAANASSDNTLSVPGVLPGDMISWNLQAPPSHIILDNAYVSAAGVVTFRWSTDGTGVTGSTVAILLEITRPENSSAGVTSLPSSLS